MRRLDLIGVSIDVLRYLNVTHGVLYHHTFAAAQILDRIPICSCGHKENDGGDGAPNASLKRDCGALLRAYKRMADPETRRRLLGLVQAAAERI